MTAEENDVIKVYLILKSRIRSDEKINTIVLIELITTCIKIIEETFKDRHGEYKQEILIGVLEHVINTQSDLNDDQKKQLMNFVHSTAPVLIETLIRVSRGLIDLGKSIPPPSGCCFVNRKKK